MKVYGNLREAIRGVGRSLHDVGQKVEVERWQGVTAPAPTLEVIGCVFRTLMPRTLMELKTETNPNLPWADMHFEERVGGVPTNPGEAYKHWPLHRRSPDEFHDQEAFTHTYQERMWSRGIQGVHYRSGDLASLVSLLKADPTTRQAYLPIWWPEDTGVSHGGRVPCTLGYWFVKRGNYLHVTYLIRSCDYFRHFRDDLYLTARLVMWIIEQLGWKDIHPGFLDFHAGSMHCWYSEKTLLQRTT